MDPIQYYMMQNQMPQFGQQFGQMQGQMQPGMQAGQMPQGLPQMQARPQLPSFTPPGQMQVGGQMQGGPISGGIQPPSPDGGHSWLNPLMAISPMGGLMASHPKLGLSLMSPAFGMANLLGAFK